MTKKHQYKMGIIGNCSYMSYIEEKNANVVWQCWPKFDSSFIFGGLISAKHGGEFSITPCEKYTSHQYYLQNTNVLVTHFKCEDGEFRVLDFAPRFELFERFHKPLMLFRKVEPISGTPLIRVCCEPVYDYGKSKATPQFGSNSIDFDGLGTKVRLTTNISKVHIVEKSVFALTETKHMILSWGSAFEAPLERTFEDFLQRTTNYWRVWVQRCTVPHMFQEEVIRSALLLKMHQYEDTGAIIASGTTSLPEFPGTQRNWDYRYCWIRDSYFTLQALSSLGHFDEMERYSHWIQNIVQNSKVHFQPVYKIDGGHTIKESELDHLEGYEGNKPVRIGNDAYTQVQHDVYGQMLLSLVPLYTDLRIYANNAIPSTNLIHTILDKIEEVIDAPDAGIWEFRGKMQHHAESFLFHWAGAKGAVKIAERLEDQELKNKAERIIVRAADNIEKCYDEVKEAYGMSHENKNLNASELLLINMRYLTDPERARKHLTAMEKELKTTDNLIYRYRDHDDFGETHATFLICGFWYAEALLDLGDVDEAVNVFKSLLTRANDLGIFSEDIDPTCGSQWGNMAQTYSHVGLINTAFKIAAKLDRPIYF